MNELTKNTDSFYNKITGLLKAARETVIQSVNNTMVVTYFEIGKLIVNQEQQGKEKAEYGHNLINELSEKLSNEFGKGFSATNIKQMRTFYLTYSKGQTASDEFKLSWSHYLKLMRIDDENERKFYEIESFKNNWSLKELQRQFDSALYTRLALSRDKAKVIELSENGLVIDRYYGLGVKHERFMEQNKKLGETISKARVAFDFDLGSSMCCYIFHFVLTSKT